MVDILILDELLHSGGSYFVKSCISARVMQLKLSLMVIGRWNNFILFMEKAHLKYKFALQKYFTIVPSISLNAQMTRDLKAAINSWSVL